ncbi:hypothetical protein [Mangrovitalea sediminis]|uniref:hypothetical protein n=1 Tax=Mangrovitalea sediminis TaxID=1982043 RepID=UPI000BE587F2|nr:hypothetical protein [Mangrovitalea sediminis]
MDKVSANNESIWSVVSPDKHVLPSASVQHTLRVGLAGFLERLRPVYEPDDAPFRSKDDLAPLSRRQLERVVPSPTWDEARSVLLPALETWRSNWQSLQAAALVVAPPFSGTRVMLEGIAQAAGWRLISPPTAEQILAGQDRWFEQFEGDIPWLLPELSHLFLRHVHGLGLMRRFLARVWSGQLGQGVIGCGSWAWEYWRQVMPELAPSALTLQSLNAARLGLWFQELADPHEQRPVQFRQADNGYWVLTARNEVAPLPKGARHSEFLRDLGAYSRGLPEVAWQLWRLALRAEPETEVAEAAAEEADKNGNGQIAGLRTVWVAPWEQLKPPSVPAHAPKTVAFVLHALLLHAGLDEHALALVSGLSEERVLQSLQILRRAELVISVPRGWYIAPAAYPGVRRYLQGAGFQVDSY